MFSQLFFLMLITMITAIAIDSPIEGYPHVISAFFQGISLYSIGLTVLYFANKRLKRSFSIDQILFFDNAIIILIIFTSFYFLNSQQILLNSGFPFAKTVLTLLSLLIYFFGLYICNYSLYRTNKNALQAIRFLVPFTFPFVLVTTGLNLVGEHWVGDGGGMYVLLLIFAILTMIFLPPLIVWTWGCPPLNDQILTSKLNTLCTNAHFSHGGYKIWTVAEGSTTAAIIGLVSPLRYILFTQKLLNVMPTESIEAILAHEIGHNKRMHLWIYPWILFGMLAAGSYAVQKVAGLIPMDTELPEWAWDCIGLATFISVIALYFRFIFGFFSRQFERQADLYIYEAGLPPQNLIDAFSTLAKSLNVTGHEPSWHHYSICERVAFLQKTIDDPSLIQKHHRNVYLYLIFFTVCLILLILLTS